FVNVWQDMYGKEPIVRATHGGLECGLFSDKIEGLDAISIGPDMFDIHTPRERMSILSTARTYNYLCEVLKEL
ncbi:MAG: aminoacyl-histidine dipeptidase, partial [Clostridia bacterium]|nr:aminoacyl-histidine dipeptidase [Clostridia bacterium]